MGVRLYSPVLGRFLQTDPIPGGSSNACDYAGQGPINRFDLDGRCWTCVSEWAAGFGDTVTFGGTKQIRRLINHGLNGQDDDMVNHHSDFYRWGGHGGDIASLVPAAGGLRWLHRLSSLSRRGWKLGGLGYLALHAPHNLAKRGTRAVWHASHWHWHFGGSDGRQARHMFRPWEDG